MASHGWSNPSFGSLRLVSEAFPAAASFCILILSRERHQTWIKPLCQLNFGKTCLKLPLARGGTPPPSGTSWGHGGGRGGSSICFPLHPALAGRALGTDRLRIPHIVPIQPRDPETQGVSSKHYHRSICVPARKAGRVHSTAPPGLNPDSSLLSQFLILLWPPSEQGPPPTPTAPHTRWPEHLRPSSYAGALPQVGFIFPPTGFTPPSLGGRSSHSHVGFSITICFLSAALDVLAACGKVPPGPSLLQVRLTLPLHPSCLQTLHLPGPLPGMRYGLLLSLNNADFQLQSAGCTEFLGAGSMC